MVSAHILVVERMEQNLEDKLNTLKEQYEESLEVTTENKNISKQHREDVISLCSSAGWDKEQIDKFLIGMGAFPTKRTEGLLTTAQMIYITTKVLKGDELLPEILANAAEVLQMDEEQLKKGVEYRYSSIAFKPVSDMVYEGDKYKEMLKFYKMPKKAKLFTYSRSFKYFLLHLQKAIQEYQQNMLKDEMLKDMQKKLEEHDYLLKLHKIQLKRIDLDIDGISAYMDKVKNTHDRILWTLDNYPECTMEEVATICGTSKRTVQRVKNNQ